MICAMGVSPDKCSLIDALQTGSTALMCAARTDKRIVALGVLLECKDIDVNHKNQVAMRVSTTGRMCDMVHACVPFVSSHGWSPVAMLQDGYTALMVAADHMNAGNCTKTITELLKRDDIDANAVNKVRVLGGTMHRACGSVGCGRRVHAMFVVTG